MNTERLDPKAVKRLEGPAWDPLRLKIGMVNDILLDVSKSATGQLTTIYIKYSSPETAGNPYAVVWIRKASELVVGLSLPDDIQHLRLIDAPKGYAYAGLTKYFVLDANTFVPLEFEGWATTAFEFRSRGKR